MMTGFIILGVSLLFLPLILIKPYKFCALNSLGTITLFISIIIMRGSQIWKTLLGKKMGPFTFMFLLTFLLELYFSLINEKYIMVLICFILHSISILYIVMSMIPNGTNFLTTILKSVLKFLGYIFSSCFKRGKKDLLPI